MKFPYTKEIITEADTISLAGYLASELKPGDLVTLDGNLGAGKTFFVKALAANWGINDISSPSFAIVNEHSGNELKLYHFDFYRIKNVYELYDIGFQDYIIDEQAIVIIEWANMFSEILPAKRMEISIELKGETRKFEMRRFE